MPTFIDSRTGEEIPPPSTDRWHVMTETYGYCTHAVQFRVSDFWVRSGRKLRTFEPKSKCSLCGEGRRR